MLSLLFHATIYVTVSCAIIFCTQPVSAEVSHLVGGGDISQRVSCYSSGSQKMNVTGGTWNESNHDKTILDQNILSPDKLIISQSSSQSQEGGLCTTDKETSEKKNSVEHPEEKTKSAPTPSENTFGQKEEKPPLTFLRNSALLLKPGQIETTLSFFYQTDKEEEIAIDPDTKNLFKRQTISRVAHTMLGLNIGIFNRIEAFARLPFGGAWVREEITPPPPNTENLIHASTVGPMDASVGCKYLVMTEIGWWPETTSSFSMTFPTGTVDKIPHIGSGQWKPSLTFSFLKTVDPLFLHWSIGYTQPIVNTRPIVGATIEEDYEYSPGASLSYHVGLGLAVNEKATVSWRIVGGYGLPSVIDPGGVGMYGPRKSRSTEPMSLSLGLAYKALERIIIEPDVSFGMNSDAGNVAFGLTLSHKF